MLKPLPPWQQSVWQQLAKALTDGRLPHAILLAGARGLGKRLLAERLQRVLLCGDAADPLAACGRCRGCELANAGNHPDLLTVTAPNDKTIRVDQVRQLNAFLTSTSHGHGPRLAMVHDADRMNLNAANSLLKTLEEPPGAAVLVLSTAWPTRLPPTVRSRCQQFCVDHPAAAEARDWLCNQPNEPTLSASKADRLLCLAGGAPLLALDYAAGDDDILALRQTLFEGYRQLVGGQRPALSVAGDWQPGKDGFAMRLRWLYDWLTDLVRLRATDGNAPWLVNEDLRKELTQLSTTATTRGWLEILEMARQLLNLTTTAVNMPLQLEALFVAHEALAGPAASR